jgi:hypothetical protein
MKYLMLIPRRKAKDFTKRKLYETISMLQRWILGNSNRRNQRYVEAIMPKEN